VIGKNVNDAKQELEQAGLVVSTQEKESNEPQGQVIAQNPGAGTGAEPGDTVTLDVSKGPPTKPVPNVTGQSCEDAERILEEAGFAVAFGFEEEGRVLLQNPSQGTGLRPGSEVTIWCGR
jgi:serine/threonine-protein kinase